MLRLVRLAGLLAGLSGLLTPASALLAPVPAFTNMQLLKELDAALAAGSPAAPPAPKRAPANYKSTPGTGLAPGTTSTTSLGAAAGAAAPPPASAPPSASSPVLSPLFSFVTAPLRSSSLPLFERINDTIMGGISSSSLSAPPSPSDPFASWRGRIRTDGGGFAGFRTRAFEGGFSPLPAAAEGMYCTVALGDKDVKRRNFKMSLRVAEAGRGEVLYRSRRSAAASRLLASRGLGFFARGRFRARRLRAAGRSPPAVGLAMLAQSCGALLKGALGLAAKVLVAPFFKLAFALTKKKREREARAAE
ncbi:hypothetical protein TeGR_g5271 [Tetraparma gracilis]|uniref:NADH:ubiquinone oxidoreductase intermediate-associated protein 30 domain-containing protein n=1 Tax=Tetraparma gracilis TaxID=2962635 RepID=A0ABQ6NDV1_9STRA|nr:hypothetical protein TeGR_g5271 [Tetraparma gracilis]